MDRAWGSTAVLREAVIPSSIGLSPRSVPGAAARAASAADSGMGVIRQVDAGQPKFRLVAYSVTDPRLPGWRLGNTSGGVVLANPCVEKSVRCTLNCRDRQMEIPARLRLDWAV